MLQLANAEVVEILDTQPQIQFLRIRMQETGRVEQAFYLTGRELRCQLGDRVLVNTTAVALDLGTGGYHIVVSKCNQAFAIDYFPSQWGHIMKQRYSPMQMAVDAVEEENSPYHSYFVGESANLNHTPVIIGELHSMLPMVALSLYQRDSGCKLVYVMPDGASLPIAISRHVHYLKQKGILSSTVTVGHAWGGDLEAVNIYTGLLAAKEIAQADIILCMLGPGVVGTSTPYGFSGVQLADIIHAVTILQGIPICVPRIQFADSRPAHVGLSHHTHTVLFKLALCSVLVPLPIFGDFRDDILLAQLNQPSPRSKHHMISLPAPSVEELERIQQKYPEPIRTMGRDLYQDASLFQTSYVVAHVANRIWSTLQQRTSAYFLDQDVLETLAKLWDAE
ncbi:DUF3866 family protein [Brevibacillus ginsengisoli]|uniref:DUF3866 family protein n=1 Tax=Brevibacillus ginsengisoli TaxID=363854 RepID=UPI003CEE0D3B